jgi:hypothetical protein
MSDIIDTRDLIEELRTLVGGDEDNHDAEAVAALDDEDRARIQEIADVLDAIGGEASYGVALIPEDDFEDYAQQLAEEIGAIDPNANWPLSCIDWSQAAHELRQDYTSVAFDGVDYLCRA